MSGAKRTPCTTIFGAGRDGSIHRNQTALKEIRDAYQAGRGQGLNKDEVVASMAAVVQRQIDSGIFISRHLMEGGAGVRTRRPSSEEIAALKEAGRRAGGRCSTKAITSTSSFPSIDEAGLGQNSCGLRPFVLCSGRERPGLAASEELRVRNALISLMSLVAASCSPGQGATQDSEMSNAVADAVPDEERSPPRLDLATDHRLAFHRPAFNMTCTPRVLGPGDNLLLRFEGEHGPISEIVSPDGQFSILAAPKERDSVIEAPVDGDELAGSNMLVLPVREAKVLDEGRYWPLFQEDGVYLFLFGTLLESHLEDKEYNAYCNVTYRSGSSRLRRNTKSSRIERG